MSVGVLFDHAFYDECAGCFIIINDLFYDFNLMQKVEQIADGFPF